MSYLSRSSRGTILHLCLLASICIGLQQALFSQDPLDEFWKDVERRKALKARPPGDVDETYGLKLMDAVGASLVVIRQEYVYEKKNIRLVRDVDEFYGAAYSIGVRTPLGILASADVSHPWVGGDSLMVAKGYSPALGKTQITGLGIDKSRMILEAPKVELFADGFLGKYTTKTPMAAAGEYPGADSIGLLVLFYRDAAKDTIKRRVYPFDPKWVDGTSVLDTQWLTPELIGGVLVRSKPGGKGKESMIAGILGAKEPHHYRLIRMGPGGELGSAVNETKVDKPAPRDKEAVPEEGARKSRRKTTGIENKEDTMLP